MAVGQRGETNDLVIMTLIINSGCHGGGVGGVLSDEIACFIESYNYLEKVQKSTEIFSSTKKLSVVTTHDSTNAAERGLKFMLRNRGLIITYLR